MLFHYDAHSCGAVCEAAYLATKMPIRVLVSPSNFYKLKALYENIPGLKAKSKSSHFFSKSLNSIHNACSVS